MSAAGIEKPAGSAGLEQRERHNSSYDKNLAQLYRRVNTLCDRWKMSRMDFEQAASIWALMFRDSAPRAIRAMYSGRPSFYSEDAKRLSLAFLISYAEASERLESLKTDTVVDAAACWRVALKLVGGVI